MISGSARTRCSFRIATAVALPALLFALTSGSGSAFASPQCLGIRHADPDSPRPDRPSGDGDDDGVDVGPFRVCLESNVTTGDSLYIFDLIEAILPSMLEVAGPPVGLDLLTIGFDPGMGGGAYYSPWSRTIRMDRLITSRGYDDDRDGHMDEDDFDGRDNDGDGSVDEDPTTNTGWDEVFVHELTHAFQTEILSSYDSWLVEGMAEAGQYFVTNLASERSLRRFNFQRFDLGMASFDLVDRDAGPLYGGSSSLARNTPDAGIAYLMAGSQMILCMEAEIAAGRSRPHPLERVTEALLNHAYEAGGWAPAIDEAWPTSIDGVWPVSRWIRARAVAHPTVRDGLFLHLAPLTTGLNPTALYAHLFTRESGTYRVKDDHGSFAFTDTEGREFTDTMGPNRFEPLSPGAYRVTSTETVGGASATGRTWFLKTPGGHTIVDGHEGTTVIFIDRDGLPVDVPDVSSNGRIVEQVPGGVVVAPASRFHPDAAVTFTSGDRILGTVTLAGRLSRVVPLVIDDPEPAGLMSWEPYHPAPGGDLTVRFRPALSILGPGSVTLSVDLPGRPPLTAPMSFTERPDVLSAQVTLPADFIEVFLRFSTAETRQGGFPIVGYRILPGLSGRIELVRVERAGSDLRLILTADPAPGDLRVLTAPGVAGPWIPTSAMPTPDPASPHAWRIPLMPEPDRGAFVRVVLIEPAGERVLHEGAVGATSPVPGIRSMPPFPNPSPDGVRWIVEMDAPWTADLQVFDTAGRRVHGPERMSLFPGRSEIRWNGLANGTRLPGGLYVMRLSGDGTTLTRRATIISDRPR